MVANELSSQIPEVATASRQHASVTKIVWTIAGSDSGGGAGIQADLATIQDLDCHACTVITTLTAQNSVNVTLVEAVSDAMLLAQLDTLKLDMPPDAIKIGLMANQQQVNQLAKWLKESFAKEADVPIILDPVMVATTGQRLSQAAVDFSPFRGVVNVITPNQSELITLACEVQRQTNQQSLAVPVLDLSQMVSMAQQVSRFFDCHLVAKGGDARWQADKAMDVYVCQHVEGGSIEHNNSVYVLSSERIDTDNNHGSGCMLSSAIACFLAHDYVLHDAVVLAKSYATQGLKHSIKMGKGAGYLAKTGWPSTLNVMPHIVQLTGASRQSVLLDNASIEQQMSQSIHQKLQLSFTRLSLPLEVYPVVSSVSMLVLLLQAGCKTLQLRLKQEISCCDKGIAFKNQQQKILWIEQQVANAIELGRKYNAQLFINDHWQLALKYGAFGVHLGQEDALSADLAALAENNIALGLSSHSYFEILLATQVNPSYIALGHIFATTTKNMPSKPQGISKLAQYCSLLKDHFPTVAIGGITSEKLNDIADTGVDNVAVVRAVTQAHDPVAAFQALNHMWRSLKGLSPIAHSKKLAKSVINSEHYQEAL
ncbi:bifunctional hydroxymethylpyrimidine kinase/phosphomethylpyrimidine kinase [Shewanella aestuarii]|uniref:hydroxymethylpyrimidine kinase n=1 Tax=Shewanella aestuarii TaxID=1028752 RepID=A0A6G9QJK9_9GAMM|nr:bifunctional hydroxymethylpyrimidine kinase/phosphomethylpyrimidine kinase [Shewanella aestuarii]QIR14754.1 thiamine-phosphate pyrophosphorylase [Shewanella aestuarii]